jgi:hypothetical protein
MAYTWRCPECRTRRKDAGLFKQHLRTSGHRICNCGGYHYSHRKGSPYCHHNPISAIYHADRQGNTEEVLLTIAASIASDAPQLAEKVWDVCAHLGLNINLLRKAA